MTNFSIAFSFYLVLFCERFCFSSRRRLRWFCRSCWLYWFFCFVRSRFVDRFYFALEFLESDFALDRRRFCDFCCVCCFCCFCDRFCARFCDVCWWWCDWQYWYTIIKVFFQSKIDKHNTIRSTSLMRSLRALFFIVVLAFSILWDIFTCRSAIVKRNAIIIRT